MIQVDLLAEEDVPTCKKETKEAIHTSAGLLRHERTLARDAMVPVVSKEKHMHMWREQFHHTKAKRAIIATPGGGSVLKACLAQGVKALVIAKNDVHMKHLRDYAIAFMLTEAKVNSACAYHVKRRVVISRLGLEEDDTQPSPLSKAMTTALDIDDTEVPAHQRPSDAIVVQDQAATPGEQPDASEAAPGSDNDASESGSATVAT